MSNFNYCPLVWHFCGKLNNHKLEKIQERALRILYNDYNSSYPQLLEKAGTTTLLIQRLRLLTTFVFKSVHALPPCLSNMFVQKDVPYMMRDSSILEQPRRRTTTYGFRSCSYLGAKLRNELPNHFKEKTSLSNFKHIIKTWSGPASYGTYGSYIKCLTHFSFIALRLYQILYILH